MLVSPQQYCVHRWSCCHHVAGIETCLACVLQPWTHSHEAQFLCWRHLLRQSWTCSCLFSWSCSGVSLWLLTLFHLRVSEFVVMVQQESWIRGLMQEVWMDFEIFCGFILIWDRTCKLNPLCSLSTSLWVPVIWLQLEAVFLLQSDLCERKTVSTSARRKCDLVTQSCQKIMSFLFYSFILRTKTQWSY